MRLSIRWRLSLWNTATLAVVLTAFAAMTYYVLAREHIERIDRNLQHEIQEATQDPKLVRDPAWIADLREDNNIVCVVYDAAGNAVERTKDLPVGEIPPAVADAAGPGLRDASLPGGRLRVLQARVRLDDRDYTVLLIAPLKEVDEEMSHFLTAILVVVPFALLAACLCGYFLAGRALAPMEQLRKRTEEITAARLDRRLPVANAHDELGRLARTINAMIARLERSFAEVRRFTADASHELRTPLTAIRLEAELALKKSLDPEERDQILCNVLEECERLTRLTEQLLALAREDAGAAPAREPLDLASLARGVAETMRPLAESRGLKLQVAVDGVLAVCGDEGRLRQVFYNLLDNAIKYTPEGGEVRIHSGRRDGAAFVVVADDGVGVAAEHLPHLFERFYRVDKARSRQGDGPGGAGLGLSIAESIVAAHGGRIELKSEPGRGMTATVTLPAAHEA
jgi:heavy metal sensor kinase